ncbi:putative methyltransferase DDB_G0268948 isoform X1 [Ornithodoros turicata]|uniref:putative methyltransferase DDB_G0268948 isoform X1 n=1 Tax=Ornithodoros turicata TaxID=34597 RepID=UPI00313A0C18
MSRSAKLPCPQPLCLDVGCGPGQSTELFCPFFERVVGIDVSETQIKEAEAKKQARNVSYQAGPAESLPFPDNSVAMIAAVNALHWFDMNTFYKEATRILQPDGVLLATIFHLRKILVPGLENVLDEFRDDNFQAYRTSQHNYFDGYAKVDFPFNDVRRKDEMVSREMPLSAVISTVKTWSLAVKMQKEDPGKHGEIFKSLENRVLSHLKGGDAEHLQIGMKVYYVLCRK